MENLKVLLVDDEVEFIETLLKRLKKRNIEAHGVTSGEQAIEYLKNNDRDVVILDVRMPGMDGIQTLRAIKKNHPLTEVIMLTGHACLEVAIEGMQIGAFDYLMKPVNIDELLYKIQDSYKKKQLQEKKVKT